MHKDIKEGCFGSLYLAIIEKLKGLEAMCIMSKNIFKQILYYRTRVWCLIIDLLAACFYIGCMWILDTLKHFCQGRLELHACTAMFKSWRLIVNLKIWNSFIAKNNYVSLECWRVVMNFKSAIIFLKYLSRFFCPYQSQWLVNELIVQLFFQYFSRFSLPILTFFICKKIFQHLTEFSTFFYPHFIPPFAWDKMWMKKSQNLTCVKKICQSRDGPGKFREILEK